MESSSGPKKSAFIYGAALSRESDFYSRPCSRYCSLTQAPPADEHSAMIPEVDITIVVPAFNEERNIKATLAAISAVASKAPEVTLEVVVVDDGSSDRTAEIVAAAASTDSRVRLLKNSRNLGLGASFRNGLSQARGRKIFIVPGDNDLPSSTIVELVRNAKTADVVMCFFINRELRGRKRNILSTIFGLIYSTAFDIHTQYINGPAVYPVAELLRLKLVSKGFSIPAEINVKLLRQGLSYFEIASYRQTGLAGSKSFSVRSLLETISVFMHLFYEVHLRSRHLYSGRPRRILPLLGG
jgi:glycosyltransferase involved in cell wall biosynthesis